MFKIFGVGEERKKTEDGIDIEITDEENKEEEIWQVALDIIENSENITILSPIAGIDLEDIDLSINKSVLTIKWERKKPEEYYGEWAKIRNNECFWGKFTRNIILPENLSFNKIKAVMENNLLIITIPKLSFDSKSIKINRIED